MQCFGAVRVVTYNIKDSQVRKNAQNQAYIEPVLQAISNENVNGIAQQIDILCLQEVDSNSSSYGLTAKVQDILNDLYGPGIYDRSLTNGYPAGGFTQGIVYNTQTIELLETRDVDNFPRAALRYKLRPVGYTSSDAVFYIYNVHLKAGSDYFSERGVEITNIRADADGLGGAPNIIYLGDFNVYSSYEPAIGNLKAVGNAQAVDPLNLIGLWNENPNMKEYHTQSPGSLTGGGMDDRFDLQFISLNMNDSEGVAEIPGSYHSFGNNGTHNINGDISTGSGAAPEILNALERASDHLPVVVDYQLPAVMEVSFTDNIPHPGIIVQNSNYTVPVSVENTANVPNAIQADELDYTIYTLGSSAGAPVYGPLPDGWANTDIGIPDIAGDAGYNVENDTFRINGAGDIDYTSDSFHYVYTPLTGDGELIAKLDHFEALEDNAQAGIMVRNGLSSADAFAMISFKNDQTVNFSFRYVNGDSISYGSSTASSIPKWLKLSRSGDDFYGYYSQDGIQWTQLDSRWLPPMSGDVYIGYAVASGNTAEYADAYFGTYIEADDNIFATGSAFAASSANVYNVELDTLQTGDAFTEIIVESSSQGAQNNSCARTIHYRVTSYQDFDGDNDFDMNDINLMLAAIGSSNTLFDLDNSGTVDKADMDILIYDVFQTSYGDTDLDADVDEIDLLTLIEHWLDGTGLWQHGETESVNLIGYSDYANFAKYWLSGI